MKSFFHYICGIVRGVTRTVLQDQSQSAIDEGLTRLEFCALNVSRVQTNIPDIFRERYQQLLRDVGAGGITVPPPHPTLVWIVVDTNTPEQRGPYLFW